MAVSTQSAVLFRRKTSMLTGLAALAATMVAMAATSPIPRFWVTTGLWLAGTLGSIAWQVHLQWHYRQSSE
ncbi:MAG: hypothetical protein M1294_05805 [Firmicutes bacterium]|uniref:Uncharacterized protein n=1 Tax=Sulfobacillus benefaciens TaxID=453960 RepID=A0A2T2WP59_9FIRM|nr:hypothetical protein [Bacillota bacterium]MCL5015407.1 hypothetical protein [Bacillota bacterium]PSR24027.1 MAG: hypothetical protein C7B43_19635 [Sulfobacillus benefaciens]